MSGRGDAGVQEKWWYTKTNRVPNWQTRFQFRYVFRFVYTVCVKKKKKFEVDSTACEYDKVVRPNVLHEL